MSFFTETGKKLLKFTQKHKKLQILNAILSQNNSAGDIIIPDFKLHNEDNKGSIAWAKWW